MNSGYSFTIVVKKCQCSGGKMLGHRLSRVMGVTAASISVLCQGLQGVFTYITLFYAYTQMWFARQASLLCIWTGKIVQI